MQITPAAYAAAEQRLRATAPIVDVSWQGAWFDASRAQGNKCPGGPCPGAGSEARRDDQSGPRYRITLFDKGPAIAVLPWEERADLPFSLRDRRSKKTLQR
jgi:hypothetical protein